MKGKLTVEVEVVEPAPRADVELSVPEPLHRVRRGELVRVEELRLPAREPDVVFLRLRVVVGDARVAGGAKR